MSTSIKPPRNAARTAVSLPAAGNSHEGLHLADLVQVKGDQPTVQCDLDLGAVSVEESSGELTDDVLRLGLGDLLGRRVGHLQEDAGRVGKERADAEDRDIRLAP